MPNNALIIANMGGMLAYANTAPGSPRPDRVKYTHDCCNLAMEINEPLCDSIRGEIRGCSGKLPSTFPLYRCNSWDSDGWSNEKWEEMQVVKA